MDTFNPQTNPQQGSNSGSQPRTYLTDEQFERYMAAKVATLPPPVIKIPAKARIVSPKTVGEQSAMAGKLEEINRYEIVEVHSVNEWMRIAAQTRLVGQKGS